jgi:hypothetical protein
MAEAAFETIGKEGTFTVNGNLFLNESRLGFMVFGLWFMVLQVEVSEACLNRSNRLKP